MKDHLLPIGVLVLAGFAPLGAGEHKVGEPPESLRRELKLAAGYQKCIVAGGFAVLGTGRVSDHALREAAYVIDRVLDGRGDLRRALVRNKVRLAVMAADELTTDVPEHSDLRPAQYWNRRARGLGPTPHRPAVSCGEENLLGYPGDPYAGENILIHEFAHALHEMALADVEKTFAGRLAAAYAEAMREGLWKGTYAATNRQEYWAEGVQSWFDANQRGGPAHNDVASRDRLEKYDPRLAGLLAGVFRGNAWRYTPPARRKEPGHLAGFDPARALRFAWPADLDRWYRDRQAERKKPR
jgi:hypothetical protein